jgi:hypothetical protein
MSYTFTDQEIAEARLVLPDARTCPHEVYVVDIPPPMEGAPPIARGAEVELTANRAIFFKRALYVRGPDELYKWDVYEYPQIGRDSKWMK